MRTSTNNFSSITIGIPVDFTGNRIEFRGFLKSEDVSDFFGLWMREDGNDSAVAFDNMQARQVKGTHDWTEYSISLPIRAEAKQLVFGVLSVGTGTTWADDLQLLVDGKPIWDVPKIEQPKTSLDLDHEFDRGSGITLTALSKTQIDNLATLGKVWGFLKYHHPAVSSGQHHWDYDLFRILPRILAAADKTAANAALHTWIASLGTITECTTTCAALKASDLYMKPDLDWIADEKLLGADLSQDLQRILRNRSVRRQPLLRLAGSGCGKPAIRSRTRLCRNHDTRCRLPASRAVSLLEHYRVLVSEPRHHRREAGTACSPNSFPESPLPRHVPTISSK